MGKALRTHGRAPISITLDGYAASHRAVHEMPERKRGMEAHQDANLEIPKHSGLAGSSRDQVQSRTHARIQALRLCCHHHCRSRTTTSYSQRPIRPRTLTPQRPSCARYLERGPRCIDQSFSKTSSCPTEIICTRALYSCLWLNGHCRRHQYLSGYVGWPERRRQLCVVRCVREA